MDNMKPLNPIQKTVVGVQFLFVAFGATVLVPLLVGLDPSTALFTAGIGTLIFHLVTKGKVPIFLGSSFAFVAPIIKATELYGLPGTMSGLVAVGTVYGLMSLLVPVERNRFYQAAFSAGGDRAGYYSDRPLAGRLRCEYGKRELAVGTGSPAFRHSRLYVGPRNVEIDPYLLWNHRRVSDCESVRLDRLQACDRSSLFAFRNL